MKSELFNLAGKTALVTGGNRGIGLAVAKGLAEHGADIALIARTKEQLETATNQIQTDTGQKVYIYPFDTSAPKALIICDSYLLDNVK